MDGLIIKFSLILLCIFILFLFGWIGLSIIAIEYKFVCVCAVRVICLIACLSIGLVTIINNSSLACEFMSHMPIYLLMLCWAVECFTAQTAAFLCDSPTNDTFLFYFNRTTVGWLLLIRCWRLIGVLCLRICGICGGWVVVGIRWCWVCDCLWTHISILLSSRVVISILVNHAIIIRTPNHTICII